MYDIHIDTAQQKLTVVGRAELDKIVKAIKKTRKIATICSHTDPNAPPPAQQPADGQPPPAEAPPAKPEEPPKDPPAPPQESQATEAKPSEEAKDAPPPEPPKIVEEVRMVHYYPHSYIDSRQHEAPRYMYHWAPEPKYRYSWMDAYDEDYYPCRHRGDSNKMTVFSEENPNNCVIM